MQRAWQEKFLNISNYDEFEIIMLLPKYWVENYKRVYPYLDHKSNIKYVFGKSVWKGYGSRYFFINKLYNVLVKIKPDIIHLEQEPWSLVAFQIVLFRNIFAPKCKIIFRTSRTFDIQLKFKFFLKYIEKYVYRNSNFAVPLNEKASLFLRRRGYYGDMQILPNGVNVHLFKKKDVVELRKELKLDGFFTIGYCGRFIKEKGIHLIIKTIRSLNIDCRLLCIGNGPYKAQLIDLIEKNDLHSKVIMLDTVPMEKLPLYISCMDVFVLASYKVKKWEEFFGRVLIEAMSCTVPVIGSNSGGISEVIGDSGLIFPEKDELKLANCLLHMHKSKKNRMNIAEMGRKRVVEKYSWDVISEQTMGIYKQLMGVSID